MFTVTVPTSTKEKTFADVADRLTASHAFLLMNLISVEPISAPTIDELASLLTHVDAARLLRDLAEHGYVELSPKN